MTNANTISLQDLQGFIERLEKFKVAVILLSPYVQDQVLYGETIDRLAEIKVPNFNPRFHRAFLVPYSLESEIRTQLADQGMFEYIIFELK